MPLSDQDISQCYERYLREHDRYVKMAEVAYEKCLEIVQKKLTVRATVQRSPDGHPNSPAYGHLKLPHLN